MGTPQEPASRAAAAGVDPRRYFTISIDLVLEDLARPSLIPVVGGLSPMKGAGLKRLGLDAADSAEIIQQRGGWAH